jgi:taurine dioxygenase
LEVIRCQPTIGAEIRGLDLSLPFADTEFAAVYDALLEHKVIFLRDQHLTQEQHAAFGQRFGPLESNPFRPHGDGHPEYQVIKNDGDNPVLSTDVWHADLTFRKKPTKFTIIRCVEIPEFGGDTVWADMCAAYDGLSASEREIITALSASHDFKNFRVLYAGDPSKRDELRRLEEQFPNPTHPVVITHPETGQRILFVNRQFTTGVSGMPEDQSRVLLEHLYAQSSVPEYQFRLKWQPGTLAVWDNRSCQHYAVNDYYPNRRHMERVAVAGDLAPYFDAAAKPTREYATIERVHAFD